jgi:hypothetical protein
MRCWGAVENDMPSLRVTTHTHGLDAISNMDLTPDGPPQADCAFESACALSSDVIRGCEPTSMLKRVTAYTNNPAQWPDAQAHWKL